MTTMSAIASKSFAGHVLTPQVHGLDGQVSVPGSNSDPSSFMGDVDADVN